MTPFSILEKIKELLEAGGTYTVRTAADGVMNVKLPGSTVDTIFLALDRESENISAGGTTYNYSLYFSGRGDAGFFAKVENIKNRLKNDRSLGGEGGTLSYAAAYEQEKNVTHVTIELEYYIIENI